MPHIVLTEEQSRVLAESKDSLEVYDSTGQLVSFLKWFEPMDAEAVARHLRQRGLPKEPGIPSERVQALLRRLEEVERVEGITPEQVRELVRRVKAGEAI